MDGGLEKVREDPIAFARIQWDTWSPPGWFDDTEFAATPESFRNPDWVAIAATCIAAAGSPGKPGTRATTLLKKNSNA